MCVYVCVCTQAEKRKYVSLVREANKRVIRAKRALKKCRDTNEKLKAENILTTQRLAVATAQLAAFRIEHPDWVPPENIPLLPDDAREFTSIFRVTTHTHTHMY